MAEISTNFLGEKSSSFTIKVLFTQYLQYWYLFILSILLAVAGAYWYLRYATPVYQIHAALLIKANPKSTSDEILQEGASKTPQSVGNEIELLKSASLMQKAVDDLKLTVGYFKERKLGSDQDLYGSSPISVYPGKLTPAAYSSPLFINILNKQQYELQDAEGSLLGKYAFSQPIKNKFGTFHVSLNDSLYQVGDNVIKIQFYSRELVAQHYTSTLNITPVNLFSTVLQLTLEDALPERGKLVLSKLLEAYQYSTLADKNIEATNTIKFIDERLRLITGELNDVERNVESYKSTENITDLSQEGNLFLTDVHANDAKINEVDVQLSVLNGVDNYLKNSQTGLAPASLNDPILTDLLRKLGDLQTQQEKYSRSMQPDNPLLKGLNTQITNTKTAIQENVANQRQNLNINRTKFQQLNSRFTSAIRTIPRKEREFITIKRQQATKESLYLLLLQKKEETAVKYASSVSSSRVIDEPTSPPYPLKPNPKNIYLVAFLAGLLLPVGGLSLRNLLNDKVKSRKDIEDETGMPVFGEIMLKPKSVKNTIIDVNTNRVIAEQFKVLRANLPYVNGNTSWPGGQVILVTSSTVGEGKSFFSTNMAFNLAQLNKRVVILELDLRSPKTTEYLGMDNGQTIGLSNYLNQQVSVSDIIRQTSLSSNLYLISSGPLPPSPSELLSNGNILTLLNELRQQFDYIILDTPPVAFVADTIILGPYADVSFYIVRQSYTPRNYMQLLSDLEARQKFKSLHVIFNGVEYAPSKEVEYGYGYVYSKTK